MKKSLLTILLMLVATAIPALADDNPYVSITTGSANQASSVSSYTATWKLKDADNTSNTWTVVNFNNNTKKWECIKCGSKNNSNTASIATDFSIDKKIEKVTVNASVVSAQQKNVSMELEVADNSGFTNSTKYDTKSSMSTSQVDMEFEVSNPIENGYYRVNFMFEATTANGCVEVDNLKYYAEEEKEEGDYTPSIYGPSAGFFGEKKVSIKAADEGDVIYYTLDGSEPTDKSAKYEEEIAISATTTVKAVAYRDGVASEIAEKTFTAGVTYATISELYANGTQGTEYRISGPLTVVYQSGYYIYLADADGARGLQLYNASQFSSVSYKQGQTVSNIVGTYGANKNNPQFTVSDSQLSDYYSAEADGDEAVVEPAVVAVADVINADNYNRYIKVENVAITQSGSNYYINDGSKDIQLYDSFSLDLLGDFSSAKTYSVTGFYIVYSTTNEIVVTNIEEYVDPNASVTPDVPVMTVNNEVVEAGEDAIKVNIGDKIEFYAKGASKLVYEVEGAEAQEIEGDTYSFEYADVATLKGSIYGVAYSEDVEYKGEALSFNFSENAPGDIVAKIGNSDAENEGTYYVGSKFVFSADNATMMSVDTIDGDDNKSSDIAEGGEITWSPSAVGEYYVSVSACNDGGSSEASYYFTIVAKDESATVEVTVDFSSQSWTKYSKGTTITWTSDNSEISFETQCSVSVNSSYAAISSSALRLYGASYNEISIAAPTGYKINSYVFNASAAPYIDGNACTKVEASASSQHRAASGTDYIYTYDSPVSESTLATNGGGTKSSNVDINQVVITLTKDATAIQDIKVENGDSEAVYYNLQGMRVRADRPGLYIRVNGDRTEKVIIR